MLVHFVLYVVVLFLARFSLYNIINTLLSLREAQLCTTYVSFSMCWYVLVCVWWDWTQIHWNAKDEEPKVTTNCRGNENENFTKCAINNNQVRKRVALRIAYIAGYNEVFQQKKMCVCNFHMMCFVECNILCNATEVLKRSLFSFRITIFACTYQHTWRWIRRNITILVENCIKNQQYLLTFWQTKDRPTDRPTEHKKWTKSYKKIKLKF